MIDKALLTGAFEKMGPEHVQMMLGAFGPKGNPVSYCRCALGFAAGFDTATVEDMHDERNAAGFSCDTLRFLAEKLNISRKEAHYIEGVHCNKGTGDETECVELVALANEWLENRPASIRPVQHLESVSR